MVHSLLRSHVLEALAAKDLRILKKAFDGIPERIALDELFDTALTFMNGPKSSEALWYLRSVGKEFVDQYAATWKLDGFKAREALASADTRRAFESTIEKGTFVAAILHPVFSLGLSMRLKTYSSLVQWLLSNRYPDDALEIIRQYGFPFDFDAHNLLIFLINNGYSTQIIALSEMSPNVGPFVMEYIEGLVNESLWNSGRTPPGLTKLIVKLYVGWGIKHDLESPISLFFLNQTIADSCRELKQLVKGVPLETHISLVEGRLDLLQHLVKYQDIRTRIKLLSPYFSCFSGPIFTYVQNHIIEDMPVPYVPALSELSDQYKPDCIIYMVRNQHLPELASFFEGFRRMTAGVDTLFALDAEWVPYSLNVHPISRANIIQIGCADLREHKNQLKGLLNAEELNSNRGRVCFLIDLDAADRSHVERLFSAMGECNYIKLLGFSFHNDISMLTGVADSAQKLSQNMIDMVRPQMFLQKYVAEELDGQVLDKRTCMSDWSRRPLRPFQMTYAAADVMALIDIYMKQNGIHY